MRHGPRTARARRRDAGRARPRRARLRLLRTCDERGTGPGGHVHHRRRHATGPLHRGVGPDRGRHGVRRRADRGDTPARPAAPALWRPGRALTRHGRRAAGGVWRRARAPLDARGRRCLGARIQPHGGIDDGGGDGRPDGLNPADDRAPARSRRPLKPSLPYTFCRWLSTVRTERKRRSAISLLEWPWAARVATSRSRRVRATTTTGVAVAGVRAPSHTDASSAARTIKADAGRRSPSRWNAWASSLAA